MDELELLLDLHRGASRQGPGGDSEVEKAIGLAGIDRDASLKIADIGCGTGASTLTLARLLNAKIFAVDFLQDFLDALAGRAQSGGVAEKITPICASMEQLPFEDEEFDVIWSEGAIYNMGFAKGVADWNRYLKPGGLLVASEITWLTNSRPSKLHHHWNNEYPEIGAASAKIKVLEDSGYTPIGYFVLPEQCWLDNYYEPMRRSFDAFLTRNENSEEARAIVEAERREIELYEKYKAYFSYGMYIAKKRSE
ncbi:class I SAM-dependent methyltransferase [Microbulbifer flavimaris]|uniref:Class I SAM-dependent methyltransferase n=1 Tax=Microbulbifer flavimaris TaxID=1781068 RepID=A0ABX4I030_9GAMM|nr:MULTISPECIES: class I SAM-dependent methyltransferase [Microbulbifer]KUJ83584.1 methyltransferase type 11 [Microbulbifer sp. ZGT114]PCO05739.1 class I SAM-dependent methyltransferase [Microbulbifer flavimaris]